MAESSVLVTRPEDQAGSLCNQLRESGYKPLLCPMMRIEACADLTPEQRQVILDLDQYQHVIFISANAVTFGMGWIEQFWPQLPSGVNWYCVGAASAALLETWGLQVRQPVGSMDSEGLLARPELQQPRGDRVLIIKGQGGRTHLRDTLAQRGARVEQLQCYRRLGPELEPDEFGKLIAEQKLTAIMVSSGEGLENMLLLLDEAGRSLLYGIPLIAPGPRVAEKATKAGFTVVITASSATDEAMLTALRERN